MRTWIIDLWDRWRSGLWFMPSILLAGAFLLAFGMLALDAQIVLKDIPVVSQLQVTPSSAQSILSTLTGALVTVAGVTFSLTMLVLSQTSSQYGPRLLRTFMSHGVTQATLGLFLGTSLYCVIVLRAIREKGESGDDGDPLWQSYTPDLAVMLGVVLSIVCLLVLVAFLNHVAQFIRAETIISSVARELDDAINRLFPQEIGEGGTEPAAPTSVPQDDGIPLVCHHAGYLSAVDLETIMRLTVENDLIVQIRVGPGHFLAEGVAPASVHSPGPVKDEVLDMLAACFLTNTRRTPRQDVECTIQELVEVAVRALSAGINDPFTAIACVDHLAAELAHMARREPPSPYRLDTNGRLRIIARPTAFEEALDSAFLQLRQNSSGKAALLTRILEGLDLIGRSVRRDAHRDAVRRHADMIQRDAERTIHEPLDRDDVTRRYRRVLETLAESNLGAPYGTRNSAR